VTTRDLKKKRGKRANVLRRCPLLPKKRFDIAGFQPDRTEIRDLNPPIRIKKTVGAFTAPCSSLGTCT
jgi:hypothetical protein